MLSKEKEMELREKIKFNERGEIANQQDVDDWIQETINTYYKSIDWDNPYYEGKGWDNPYADEHHLPEDNKLLEEISVIIFSESTKNRKQRGIDVRGEVKTINKISPLDVGNQYKWKESYQLNGKRIPVDKVSLSDTRQDSKGETVSYQCDEYCCRIYEESSRVVDSVFNQMTTLYYQTPIEERNELLYKMLINLTKFDGLDALFIEAYIFFIKTELNNYKLLNNQKAIIGKLFAGQEITYAERRNLKRALNIKG